MQCTLVQLIYKTEVFKTISANFLMRCIWRFMMHEWIFLPTWQHAQNESTLKEINEYFQKWFLSYASTYTYVQLALLKSNLTMVVVFSFCTVIHDLLKLFQYFCIEEERNGDLTKSIERLTKMTSKQNKKNIHEIFFFFKCQNFWLLRSIKRPSFWWKKA